MHRWKAYVVPYGASGQRAIRGAEAAFFANVLRPRVRVSSFSGPHPPQERVRSSGDAFAKVAAMIPTFIW